MCIDLCLAARDKLISNFFDLLLLLIIFIWFGIITVKTFANMFDPIIKPTLRNANFGPKTFVNPNDKRVNKINIIETNKRSFLINSVLHKKS